MARSTPPTPRQALTESLRAARESLAMPASDPRILTPGVAPIVVRALLAEVRRAGIEPERLLHGLSLRPADLDAPGCMVSVAESLVVARRALQATGNPMLGLELGRQLHVTALGALALGLMSSRTVGDALTLALRHPASAGLLVPVQELRSDALHVLQLPRMAPADRDVEPFVAEQLFAGIVRLVRQGTGVPWSPVAVELARDRPADAGPYEDWFGCPVDFGAGNRLVSDARTLDQPLPSADATTHHLAGRLLHEQAARAAGSTVVRATMRLLAQNLLEPPTPQQIADALHISERTLRRRLTDGNTSYRDLLDELRKVRALDLVRQGDLALSQVASETGFTDSSNFRRAFVRWTGRTPSSMRRPGPQHHNG